jgi:hypothetical protein
LNYNKGFSGRKIKTKPICNPRTKARVPTGLTAKIIVKKSSFKQAIGVILTTAIKRQNFLNLQMVTAVDLVTFPSCIYYDKVSRP